MLEAVVSGKEVESAGEVVGCVVSGGSCSQGVRTNQTVRASF